MNNKVIKNAVVNALVTVIYVISIASFLFYASHVFGQDGGASETVLVPIVILLLFVLSAAITGSLVFARPVLWYLDGKKKEALSLLACTLTALFVIIVCVLFGLYLSSSPDRAYNEVMNGYVTNIEKASIENENFRKVLYTSKNSQLVLMNLKPGEEIGSEVHDLDQFIRIEAGSGKTILNGVEHVIEDGSAIVVPAGVEHNIINTSNVEMKLYTVYSPPNHKDGTIHVIKADAEADKADHFDGVTTE